MIASRRAPSNPIPGIVTPLFDSGHEPSGFAALESGAPRLAELVVLFLARIRILYGRNRDLESGEANPIPRILPLLRQASLLEQHVLAAAADRLLAAERASEVVDLVLVEELKAWMEITFGAPWIGNRRVGHHSRRRRRPFPGPTAA